MRISIFGCGWMGLPLGRALAAQGHAVRGSTTTPAKLDALADAGITPHRLVLDPDLAGDTDGFFDADVLVFDVPPPRGRDDLHAFHLAQIDAAVAAIASGAVPWVVMASSTGVYPDVEATFVEDDVPPGTTDADLTGALDGPRRATGRVIAEAEARFLEASAFDATVVRFGGLYGPDRHPGRFLAGRTGLAKPHAPVNLIHLDDCLGLLRAILAHTPAADVRGHVFNAVAPAHPTKEATYTHAAEALDLPPPQFDMDDARGGKAISPAKAQRVLAYTFLHPSPLGKVE